MGDSKIQKKKKKIEAAEKLNYYFPIHYNLHQLHFQYR